MSTPTDLTQDQAEDLLERAHLAVLEARTMIDGPDMPPNLTRAYRFLHLAEHVRVHARAGGHTMCECTAQVIAAMIMQLGHVD